MAQRRRRRQERVMNPLVVVSALALVALVGWLAWGAVVSREQEDVAPDRERVTAFITTDTVNLRSGPGTSFDVLGVVPEASAVDVVGDARDGFLPVRAGGVEAWIAADYLVAEGSVRAWTLAMTDMAVDESEPLAPTGASVAISSATEAPLPAGETVAADMPAGDVVVDAPPVMAGEVEVKAAQPGERWVEVDRSTATVTLHEGDQVVAVFTGLIGKDPSADGFYATATGTFHVYSMNRELTETPFAPGVYLTDWVGFDPDRSNGFHSPVRDAQGNVVATGGTATLGCVRLGEDEARRMYDFAFIGMRVEIHD